LSVSEAQLFGGVETGGTWCVCAIGSGPQQIVAREQIPTTDPQRTVARIIDFFQRNPAPVAIGVGSFGPVDLHVGSPHWGEVTRTPKPGWSNAAVGSVLEAELGVTVRLTPTSQPRRLASTGGARVPGAKASVT
jgi:fructokinase